MVTFKHDILLKDSVLHLVLLNEYIFSNRLDRVQLLVGLQLSQKHFTERTSSDDHQEVEVLKSDSRLVVFIPHKLSGSKLLHLLDCAPSFAFIVGFQVLEVLDQIIKLYKGLVEKV